MIDLLVSRFLYVLCWRNKVVIVLIILSASLGMLMMLSYHGGSKHPSQVNEILRSRKGQHLPLEHHFDQSARTVFPPKPGESDIKGSLTVDLGDKDFGKHETETWSNGERMKAGSEVGSDDHSLKREIGFPMGNENEKVVSGNVKLSSKKSEKDIDNAKKNVMKQDMKEEKKGINRLQRDHVSKPEMKEEKKGIDNLHRHHVIKPKMKEKKENHNEPKVATEKLKIDKSIDVHNNQARKLDSKFVHSPKEELPDPVNKAVEFSVPMEFIPVTGKAGRTLGNVPKSKPTKASDGKSVKKKVESKNALGVPIRKETKSDLGALQLLVGKVRPSNSQRNQVKMKDRVSEHQQMQVKVMNQELWGDHRKWHKKNVTSIIDVLPKEDTSKVRNQIKTISPDQSWSAKLHDLKLAKLEKLRESLDSLSKNNKLSVNVDLLKNRIMNYTNDLKNLHRYIRDPKQPQSNSTNLPAPHPVIHQTSHIPDISSTPSSKNISSMMLALARQKKPPKRFKPYHSTVSYRPQGSWPEMLAQWKESEESYCDGSFISMNNEFAQLKNVIIDRNFCHGRNGGEQIHEVINQPEDEEYHTYFPGFFQLACPVKPQIFFNNNNHLNQWLYSVSNVRDASLYSEVRSEFTIAIVRYEYANMYHTSTDFFNAFMLMEYFNKTQAETNILIIDGHPIGALDPVWNVLFNSSHRISQQSMRTKYTNLVWGILGYNSPMMDHYAPNIPLVEEFRTFFLLSYRINENRKLDCDKINVLFIWRRDYVAHPRNPTGSISRKIQNEQELVVTLRQNFPTFSIKGIQIDLFDMDQQLKFITETDVLIGMHGAGLTHAMFLPKHAGMIELLPTYWSAANEHFHAITRWRHLHYRQWVNADPQNEQPNHFTKIPPEVLNELVTDMVKVVCGLATDPPDIFVPPQR